MTGSDPPGPRTPPAPGPHPLRSGWKELLALLSLSLSVLLWANGLASSLERPSVVNSLSLRQLELAALASEAVPPAWRPLVVGEDPRGALAEELERQIAGSGETAPAVQRLELVLLQRQAGEGGPRGPAAAGALSDLVEMVEEPRRPLLQALIDGSRASPRQQGEWLAPWSAPEMVRQLSCEQLGGPAASCPAGRGAILRVFQLLAVTLLPVLLVVAGIGLLLFQGWLILRRRQPAPAPLQGPPLSLLDGTLLIAGGFVVLGEVLLPELVQGWIEQGLAAAGLQGALAQGLQVLLLYLTLMAAPLTLLALLLPRGETPPAGGWLQWHWRPLWGALRQALAMLLMVLPVVAFAGWVTEKLWPDPGGSNPLLELVLTSESPLALACFALTAMVMAPLFEELLFRGVLLPVLGVRTGGGWAVLISAAVFALAHLSLGELVPLFVLGIGLGILRWRSGRLASSVLMHALWNGLTFANLLLLADGMGP